MRVNVERPGRRLPARAVRIQGLLYILICLALLLVPRCARRMPPPSPDRFPPRLELIRTRGRAGLELFFDEAIDVAGIPFDSLLITAPGEETLAIRGLTPGRGGDRLLIWTERQEPVVYRLSALVPDVAGNYALLRTRFRGGSTADTIPPRVTSVRPQPGQTGYVADEVRFAFSKPMDTTVTPELITIPVELENLLVSSWEPDWQMLVFRPPDRTSKEPEADSIPGEPVALADDDDVDVPKAVVTKPARHIVLLPGLRDMEGNYITRFAATSFTADTILSGVVVPGRVDGPLPILVFLNRQRTARLGVSDIDSAAVITDEKGAFNVRVREGIYEAVAVSDTSGDGKADFTGRLEFSYPGPESLLIKLEPELEPRAIGKYRR